MKFCGITVTDEYNFNEFECGDIIKGKVHLCDKCAYLLKTEKVNK